MIFDSERSNAQHRKKAKCPICGKPPIAVEAPFCSRRCRDVDLNRWLDGGYRIETDEAPGPEDGDNMVDRDRG